MNRTPVKSSNIKSVGYDAGTKTLEVEFSSGSVYSYADVPPATHEAFISAKSVGSAFATTIRGKFEHTAAKATK